MARCLLIILALSFLMTGCNDTNQPSRSAGTPIGSTNPIMQLLAEICSKEIVLLGESDFHGDGRTIEFKTALVQRLINECGFNAVYFESSFYDFLALSMKMQNADPVSQDMLASSMGMIRNQTAEIAPLIPFLFDALNSGHVVLGGLDNQLGARGSFYSLEQMLVDLTNSLTNEDRMQCKELLRQRIWYDFPEGTEYNLDYRDRLLACTTRIRSSLSSSILKNENAVYYRAMLDNIDRELARDFAAKGARFSDRDTSMFLNLQWLIAHSETPPKIIVWSANIHVSKNSIRKQINFGALVKNAFGGASFSLGFSAASGSYRSITGKAMPIPEAPAVSLEYIALAAPNTNIAYVDGGQLKEFGEILGALFQHAYKAYNWQELYDGIIIFRTEAPTTQSN